MKYYLLCILSWFLNLFPLRLFSYISYLLAILAFEILGIRKKIILNNLDIAFENKKSKQEKYKIARLSYYHLILTSFEFIRSFYKPVVSQFSVEGEEIFYQFSADKKPLFVLLGHIGNWELIANTLALRHPNLVAVVKKVGSEQVNKFVGNARKKHGWKPIERTPNSGGVFRQLLKAIKDGSFIGFVMDQRRGSEEPVMFFSKPARTNSTLASLWKKYKIPIVSAHSWRDKNLAHHVKLLPPLELSDDMSVDEIVIKLNQALEKMILIHPEQYLWQHDRWKI